MSPSSIRSLCSHHFDYSAAVCLCDTHTHTHTHSSQRNGTGEKVLEKRDFRGRFQRTDRGGMNGQILLCTVLLKGEQVLMSLHKCWKDWKMVLHVVASET